MQKPGKPIQFQRKLLRKPWISLDEQMPKSTCVRDQNRTICSRLTCGWWLRRVVRVTCGLRIHVPPNIHKHKLCMIQVGNPFQLTETPSTCIGSNSPRVLWRLWGGLWWLWRGVYQCMVLRFEVGSKQDSFQCEHSLLALLRWPITLHLRWFYLCIYMCVFLCVLLTCTCWFGDILVCTIVAFFHFGLLVISSSNCI